MFSVILQFLPYTVFYLGESAKPGDDRVNLIKGNILKDYPEEFIDDSILHPYYRILLFDQV